MCLLVLPTDWWSLLPIFMMQYMTTKTPKKFARKQKPVKDMIVGKNNKDAEAVIVGKIIKKMMNANLLGGALVAGAFAYETSKNPMNRLRRL